MTNTDDDRGKLALEPGTEQFLASIQGQQALYTLPPSEARAAFARLQSRPVGKPNARVDDVVFPTGLAGPVQIRIVRPRVGDRLPLIVYCHGGGWICGGNDTHDRLVHEIAVGASAALLLIGYDRAPEARHPLPIEQAYGAIQFVVAHAGELNVDATRLAVVGDGTGAHIAAAVALLARDRRGPKVDLQILVCPVIDMACDTPSHRLFADGLWLTGVAMQTAWRAYLPEPMPQSDVPVSLLRTPVERLANLPDALVITAEFDVTRDEGECYARNLLDAGVRVTSVRYNGTIHDFVVLNALADTPAARGAIAQIIAALKTAFG